MKDHLKVTALILALLTVISLFAGCNKNKEDDTGMPAFIFKPEYKIAEIQKACYLLFFAVFGSLFAVFVVHQNVALVIGFGK